MLWLWKWNWVGSWTVWGWTNENFEVLCDWCCMRGELGLWLTAIVWIARPCVTHVAKLNYEGFECVHVHPYPFYVIQFNYLHKAKFWKRRISCFEMIVAIITSAWWPILTKWIQFWEWTHLNGGIPKEFYKGVSCMIKDFAVKSNKLVSRYGHTL